MPSPKRRAKPYRGGLRPDELLALLHGGLGPFEDEDEAAVAWSEHREEVATAARPPLVPWAAIRFDGAAGHSSPYCHLGAPHCHPEPIGGR